MALNFFHLTLVAVLLSGGVFSAPVGTTEEPEPDPSLTIDELISNAGVQADIDSMLKIAKDPSNPDNYVDESLIRKGSVLWDMDMLFTAEQWKEIEATESGRTKRKAIRHNGYRWPNGEIPYEMRPNTFSGSHVRRIEGALREWSRQVCVTFRKAVASDRNKIVFQNGGGCSSYVGRVGGAQPITLARGCRYHGIITHEVGHAIGFQHEQTRPDRDQYVTINKQNIIPSTIYNFRLFNTRQVNDYNVPYDYLSVMHYGPRAFTRNGLPTITVKDPKFANAIGNRVGLSFRDIKLANLMYDCAGRSRCGAIKCPGEGFVDKDCNCKCPNNDKRNPAVVCTPLSTPAPTTTTTVRPGSRIITTTKPITTTTTAAPTTTTASSGCEDLYSKYCASWAADNGCEKFKSLMHTGCKRTCGLCDKVIEKCFDENSAYCPQWRDKGYCTVTHYKRFMSSYCRKSCGLCASTFAAQGNGKRCVDKTSFCPMLSGMNMCKSNWEWMLRYCQKSCDACRAE